MTRVNIIPPQDLMDQHLMAEFREIRHVGPSLQRTLSSKNGNTFKTKISETYTLNKGHVTFFYDKGLYLHKRFLLIKEELIKRGFNINKDIEFNLHLFPEDCINDYTPTQQEIDINLERINLRISEKTNFYKKTKHE
jgi:deoxyribonuclease (pyrimidine dimer)